MLQDLHSSHLGVEKRKSLTRLTCYWPELNEDIKAFVADCTMCKTNTRSRSSNWTPWPAVYKCFQSIHADYVRPFDEFYALIVTDAYSKWPEIFFAKMANVTFTLKTLCKCFSREGVAHIIVTDNGTHFTKENLGKWLRRIGCRHILTAPRHPASNGIAENFVCTFKSATGAGITDRNFTL